MDDPHGSMEKGFGNEKEKEFDKGERKQTAEDDDQNASCNTEPLPAADQQENSNSILQIFPEEIWILLSDKLDDADDFEMLINSSLPIRHILSPQRAKRLFTKAWSVLGMKLDKEAQHLEQERLENYSYPSGDIQPEDNSSTKQKCISCGMERAIRPFSHILTLRLVCKEWCGLVDNFYNKRPHLFTNEEHPKKEICSMDHWLHNHFDDEDDIFLVQHFMPHFNKSREQCPKKKSPFIGRSIYFEMDFCHINVPHDNVATLLGKYGHALRFCTATQCPPRSERESYLQMKNVLELMPNLESLRLDYIRLIQELGSEELLELNEEIQRTRMQRLFKLQFLRTRHWPAPIFNEFIRANNHLSKLEIIRTRDQEDYDIYSVKLENLTQLSIPFYSAADFLKFSGLQAPFPLTKLHIDFQSVVMKWSRVFQVLEKNWGNTLTDLVITLPTEPNRWAIPTLLELKRLKRLMLTMDNYYSLDFLLGMTGTLESLEVHVQPSKLLSWRDHLEKEKTSILKFLSCESRALESNVWENFPKLKRCRYFDTTTRLFNDGNSCVEVRGLFEMWYHTRQDWQAYLKNPSKYYRHVYYFNDM